MIDAGERALELDDHPATARLVYLALRADGWSTTAELAERVGVSRHTAGSVTEALVDDGWAESRTRTTGGRGRSPTEWQPMVSCEFCDERFPLSGIGTHEPHCDDDTLTAYDVSDMDPEDIGLDSDTPEPTGGLR